MMVWIKKITVVVAMSLGLGIGVGAIGHGWIGSSKTHAKEEVKPTAKVSQAALAIELQFIRQPNPQQDFDKLRERAARNRSASNLKQIGLAMHTYHDAFGNLPAEAIFSKDGKPLLSWRVAILPFIEQETAYKQFKLDEPWDSEHNKKLLEKMPNIFGERGTQTHYRIFTGKGMIFDGEKGLPFRGITDGTSNTIMVVEAADSVPWTKPDELLYDPNKPLPKLGGTPFKDGFHVLRCDGSVQFVKTPIKEKQFRALLTPAGGEVIEPPDDR